MDYDQTLSATEIYRALQTFLGENVRKESIDRKPCYIYTNPTGGKTVLLCKNISYLGIPHPHFKKRIQIPLWYKDYCIENNNLDIRYIGIYHYDGLFVFVDFDKTRYITGKSHNSSAHVFTNDLYQSLVNGVFQKTDANGNIITTIKGKHFKSYLDGIKSNNEIFDTFNLFNSKFKWNSWITAERAIKEMQENNWSQWRQAEWAGWFLEYLVDSFIKTNRLEKIMVYTGLKNKTEGSLDFDLFFPSRKFQGDLKASDITKNETPGNDQENLLESINRFGRFWFVVYEHDTIKDKDVEGNPSTTFRNNLLCQIDGTQKSPTSYLSRMKHSVNFRRMMIIEVNRINSRLLLKDFNQGHQPDGSPRKQKFSIRKRSNDIENFVIYRYGQF